MNDTSARSSFWKGFRTGAPFVLVVAPFGLVFGVVGTEAGLNLAEVMGFSILVIAGASQLAAVQLMSENAPTLVVIATALAVNLRMAMYSASLAPHLGAAPLWQRSLVAYLMVDQSYAVSAIEYDNRPHQSVAAKIAFFFGTTAPVCSAWYVASWIGAEVGTSFPPGLGLDFAVPIAFLAIIAPMLRTAAHVAAALVSVVLALVFAFLPYNLGLLIAAVAAMATGARVEIWQARQRERAQ